MKISLASLCLAPLLLSPACLVSEEDLPAAAEKEDSLRPVWVPISPADVVAIGNPYIPGMQAQTTSCFAGLPGKISVSGLTSSSNIQLVASRVNGRVNGSQTRPGKRIAGSGPYNCVGAYDPPALADRVNGSPVVRWGGARRRHAACRLGLVWRPEWHASRQRLTLWCSRARRAASTSFAWPRGTRGPR